MSEVRVLVAEDIREWQMAICDSLMSLASQPTVVTNYDEAAKFIQDNELDLIIIDLNLPASTGAVSEMPGMDLLREIRNSKSNRYCVIIIITSHGTPKRVVSAIKDYGVLDVIDKHDFQSEIDRLVTTARAAILQSKQPKLTAFLCHSVEDKPEVRKLYQRLRQDEIMPWFDEEDLLPGDKWKVRIRKAVVKSDVIIICLSKNSVAKTGFVQNEIKFALEEADKKPPDTIFIIPTRLEDCKIPDSLSEFHWVNLYEDQGYERLMKALKARASGKET